MLNVERSDKKLDPRFDEIRQDWRTWANRNGYTEVETIPIQYNMMNVVLEILENPIQKDAYLLYLPLSQKWLEVRHCILSTTTNNFIS